MRSRYLVIFGIVLQGHCNGLFEDIQETLTHSLSYLKKGLEIVQNVEEFVDNTIGEDCQFECKKSGYVPVPKDKHRPTSNGCGSLDFLFDDTEESFVHVEKEFTQCCDVHDFCYDTCTADKDECDLKFKKCLYATCRKKKHEFFDAKKCRLKAKLFYITVLGVGCQSYINAQKEACQCVKAPHSEL